MRRVIVRSGRVSFRPHDSRGENGEVGLKLDGQQGSQQPRKLDARAKRSKRMLICVEPAAAGRAQRSVFRAIRGGER